MGEAHLPLEGQFVNSVGDLCCACATASFVLVDGADALRVSHRWVGLRL